jgi:hypothetical protein
MGASDPTRRSVLRGVAAVAGAGLATGTGALAAVPRPASGARHLGAGAADAGHQAEPVVVHVRDVRSGDMELFAGTSHAKLRDPALAARLARAITRS